MSQSYRTWTIVPLALCVLISPAMAGQGCEPGKKSCMADKPPTKIVTSIPDPPPMPQDLPPPRPECIPAGSPNAWYCDGPPQERKMEQWEKDLQDFVQQKHPESAFDKNGKPTQAPDLPPEII